MRFAILGPGAIGSLIAGILVEGGKDVTLVARPGNRAETLKSDGLNVIGLGKDIHVRPPVVTDAEEAGRMDVVFVTVKAYDTETAIRQHRALVGDDTLVVSLQNGVGNVEALGEVVGADRVLAGSVTAGAYLDEAGVLNYAGRGEILIGELGGGYSTRAEVIAEAMARAGLDAAASDDINKVLFTKLAINCAINPLTALIREKNGEVVRREALKALIKDSVAELAEVADAEGVILDASALTERAFEVAELTAENRSSMLKDVLSGRKTEIDAICGAVCRLGEKHGIATPVNETLARLVTAVSIK